MTAKATTGANAPEKPVRPTDLSHIRVGPPFTARFVKACAICREDIGVGVRAAIVENSRTGKKATVHEDCLTEDADLLARRDTEDINSFLA